jgi:hypothetical protein
VTSAVAAMLQVGPETALDATLSAAGLDASHPALASDKAPPESPDADVEALCATRWAVSSGDVIRLTLSDDRNPLAAVILAPAEIIALTAELLAVARVRVGR